MRDYAAEYVDKKMEILEHQKFEKAMVTGYEEEYVKVNGIEQYFLHYPAKDSDTVVVFVHGGPGYAIGYYGYMFRPRNEEFSLVFYDQRGAGKTQFRNNSKPEEVTLETLLQDLDESVGYLKGKYPGKRIVILGHSWGSVLGIEYAKHHQDKVSAYVGCGQVVDFIEGERAAYKHLLKEIMDSQDNQALEELKECEDYPDNLLRISFDKRMQMIQKFRLLQIKYKDAGFREGDEATEKMLLESPTFGEDDMEILKNYLYVNNHLIGNTLTSYSTSDFKKFNIPVYFIQGRNDYQTTSSCVEEYCDSLDCPDKKFYWVENTGHLLYLEEPDLYNQFLDEICGRIRELKN